MKNDARALLPDADFMREYGALGPHAMSRKYKVAIRGIYSRRQSLERQYGMQIRSPDHHASTRRADDHAAVIRHEIKDGIVLIGSDAHIWPGKPSVAMRAFVAFCKEYRPKLAIMNGDVLDLPQVSRHPPIGHQKLPDIQDEIEAAQEQLHLIELAVSRSCPLVWTLGNHDARFETRLATVAREYARLHGHSLKDWFPAWSACWRCDINNDVTVRHRPAKGGGVTSTHNSTLWSGKTSINGHLHSQKVTPFSDYNGTRWGVDTGCLADPSAQAFVDYTEAGPLNWRSGFALLTFKDGELLPPELITVYEKRPNSVVFRGQIIKV